MTTPTCSKCNRVIPSEDINVAQDIAYCRACNLSHRLSALAQGADLDAGVDLAKPPAGAWCRREGSAALIGATHRSVGSALGLLAISLFWNGIVSVFVLLAIAGTLRNLHIPLPHWFPTPNMNDSPMGVGMTSFLWIFLTPFIVIGLTMMGAFLSCLGGKTEVRIGHSEGVVSCGIGALKYRRRFDPKAVTAVRVEDLRWRDSDGDARRKAHILIELIGGKQVKFGTMLSEARRKFVAAAVRKTLMR